MRLLAGRTDVPVVAGRLDLEITRTAPTMGPPYGQTASIGTTAVVASAPLDVPPLLEAGARIEVQGRLPTVPATDGQVYLGPTGKGPESAAEYRVVARLDLAEGGGAKGLAPVVLLNPRLLYANVEQFRDTGPADNTFELTIGLHPANAPVGGSIRGQVVVQPRPEGGPVGEVVVRLVRRLEFTEPSMPGVVRDREWTVTEQLRPLPSAVQPGQSGTVGFELDAPTEPTFYDGERFSVRWLVEARVARDNESDAVLRAEVNVYSGPG